LDHRPFYVIGDFVANVVIGTIVGLVCWAIVSPSWNMWLAMFAMMPVGTVVGFFLFFPFAIKLGAMEVMVPLMFTGELTGMVVGMGGAMYELSMRDGLLLGAATGAAGIVIIWIVNSMLRGITREAQEG
jgi:hypothetical protein